MQDLLGILRCVRFDYGRGSGKYSICGFDWRLVAVRADHVIRDLDLCCVMGIGNAAGLSEYGLLLMC